MTALASKVVRRFVQFGFIHSLTKCRFTISVNLDTTFGTVEIWSGSQTYQFSFLPSAMAKEFAFASPALNLRRNLQWRSLWPARLKFFSPTKSVPSSYRSVKSIWFLQCTSRSSSLGRLLSISTAPFCFK